jgi:hypothetical protein
MGLLNTRWEATYQGHSIVIARNELTKGFRIDWDGQELARRSWSFVGLGELHGTAEIDGKHIDVHVKLDWGDGPLKGIGTDGKCILTVGGHDVPVTHIK